MSTPTKPRSTERERQLQAELGRAYEHLTDVTTRLLIANEAGEAALSTHDRTELSEKCLAFCARGAEVRRAALFLVDGEGLSIGATLGLAEDEVAALPESAADVDACHEALASGRIHVLDPALVEGADLTHSERDDEGEEAEAPAVEEAEDGDGLTDAEEGDADEGIPEETAGEEGTGEEPEETGAIEADSVDEVEVEAEGEVATDGAEVVELSGDGVEGTDAGGACFGVYFPVFIDGAGIAVLALGERAAGRSYGNDELSFQRHVLRQFAAALTRSSLIEQNHQRLQELDALLEISRQTTSTLDLGAVLRAVVNTVGAVVPNDRAEIALVRGGGLRLEAVSNYARLDMDQAAVFQLIRPLEYLSLNPVRLSLGAGDLLGDERPAGADVFETYFKAQDMHAFMAIPLKDEQGLLGVLCLESRLDSWDVEPAEGDALAIVAAQTAVAIRNAQLYGSVPLRGMARPMSDLRARLATWSPRRRMIAAVVALAGFVATLFPIYPERTGGPAEVRPLRFQGIHAQSEGVIGKVFVRGGDPVGAGQPIAELEDLDLVGRVTDLSRDIQMTRRDVAAARERADMVAWRAGQIRLGALERTLEFENQRLRGTTLVSPLRGQILELGLATRVGQHLTAGERFCTVAALDPMSAEVEVTEAKISRVTPGSPVAVKVQAFPGRTFLGHVTEVGYNGASDGRGDARFAVRATIENSEGRLRPGMTGIGKVTLGRRSLAAMALEPLWKAIQLKFW